MKNYLPVAPVAVGSIAAFTAVIDLTRETVVALVAVNRASRASIRTRKAECQYNMLFISNVVAFNAGFALVIFALEGTVACFPSSVQGGLSIATEVFPGRKALSLFHRVQAIIGIGNGYCGCQAEVVDGDEEDC